jgi:VCBS repeat-containing protein
MLEFNSITYTVAAGATLNGDLVPQVVGGVPPYTFTLITGPNQGTLTLDPSGTFVYKANPDASETDQFVVTVQDSQAQAVSIAAVTGGTVLLEIQTATETRTPTPTVVPTGTTPPLATPIVDTPTPLPATGGDGQSAGDGQQPANPATDIQTLPSTGSGNPGEALGSPAGPAIGFAAGILVLMAMGIAVRRRRQPR